MAHATLFRKMKRGSLRSHTSHVKPLLNEANKTARLQFFLSRINKDTMLFDDMLNAVHVDEKNFYVTEPKRRFLLLPDEPAPTPKVRSKRFITRVMFLAAVGRPRYDKEKQQVFDGKVGIWAFVERVVAQRSSSRRPAGTIITKEVSVNKTKCRDMLTSNLLPTLHERWPTNEPLVIQQDNSPAHIAPEDSGFLDAAAQCGHAIRLKCQPPNSPDLNVLDLGLFNSIQAIKKKKSTRTIDELIEAVTDAFWEVPSRTVNAAFLSLQCSMDECIIHAGDNEFKPRHMSKARLEREGRPPLSIRCSERAKQILSAPSVF
ncbi:hypothetical protein PC128_g13959 [Phytophthora cactorum]|nr:hypothetical protein PC128_g13959 [Phytophthora cactorum]